MDAKQNASEKFALAFRQHQTGHLVEAERLYRLVCAIDPTHVRALHCLGVLSHQRGRNDAVALLSRAISLKPDFAQAHNDLGVVLGAKRRFGEALHCFQRAVSIKPDYAEAYNNIGNALKELGRLDEAIEHYLKALELRPDNPTTHIYLGNAARLQGRLDDAANHYAQSISLDPKSAGSHYNLGAVFKELGRLDEAVTHYVQAVALAPNFADAHNNLGNALRELGKIEEAIAHCRRAIALQPNFAGAHNNLGNALKELGQLDEAAQFYECAVAIAPDFAAPHFNLGATRRSQGRIKEAAACFARTLTIEPDYFEAKLALCMSQLPVLYNDEQEIERQRDSYYKRLLEVRDDLDRRERLGDLAETVGSQQPFYLPYQGREDRELQSIYGALMCKIMAARYPLAPPTAPPASHEPLRIGIVSGFFRRHSNWKIPIKGWLSQLDRNQFQLFGYHTGTEMDDETKLAAGLCQQFLQGPLGLDQWRAAILADAPHVLIYPEVGMDPVTAQLAAQRLAFVQCASWGHPETTGFPTIDFYLSSDLMEPPDGQDHYTERLVRLPNLSIFYEPADVRAASITREELGFRPTAMLFWCAQSPYKYLPRYDEIFPRVALGAGDCQFVFIEPAGAPHLTELFRKRLDHAFGLRGLRAADHCLFLPRLNHDRFIAAMGQCDVFLDSIGWSGCNSTLESLAHDLPIVTMIGSLMRGRHAAAILSMMGINETVATSLDDYVTIAINLAKDQSFRAAITKKTLNNKHLVYRDRSPILTLESFLNDIVRRGVYAAQ
jgi:protein O-GlcNAc transferase